MADVLELFRMVAAKGAVPAAVPATIAGRSALLFGAIEPVDWDAFSTDRLDRISLAVVACWKARQQAAKIGALCR